MAEFLKSDWSLNTGREKINEILTEAEANASSAKTTADSADTKATTALDNSESTQQQLDTVIIESGTSDAETIQARTNGRGNQFDILKERLDDLDFEFEQRGVNVRWFGASGSDQSTTGSISAGSNELTVADAIDFEVGHGILIEGAGTGGVAEESSLQIATAPTTAGDIIVTLDGIATNIAVDPAVEDTAIAVSDKIRSTSFSGWTTGGTVGTDTVTFTCDTVGEKQNATYNANDTDASGIMTTTTEGQDGSNLVTEITAINGTTLSIADSASTDVSNVSVNHDDTQSILDAVVTGKDVYAPTPVGSYRVSSLITLGEGQTFYGAKSRSLFTFTYTDDFRGYFKIDKPNSTLTNVDITSTSTEDSSNAAAIAMRLGAVNCLVDNCYVYEVPANAYSMEEAVECRMTNIRSYRARRHAMYIIACDHVTVDGFEFYENKWGPFVIRGKSDLSPISDHRIRNGFISGYHPDSANWNAIVLAQHPDQDMGTTYHYQDVIIENVTVKSNIQLSGYGSFFTSNGETFENFSFINNKMYGSGMHNAFPIRNGKNILLVNNVSYNSYASAYNITDSENVKMDENKAYNPVDGGDPSTSNGVNIGGTSKNIIVNNQTVIDNRGTPIVKYGVSITSANVEDVKINNLTTENMVNASVNIPDPSKVFYGDIDYFMTNINDLSANQSAVIANAQGGTGTFIASKKGYLRGISISTSTIPTVGQATIQIRVNNSMVKSRIIDNSSNQANITFFLPEDVILNIGDEITIRCYADADFDVTADMTFSVIIGYL